MSYKLLLIAVPNKVTVMQIILTATLLQRYIYLFKTLPLPPETLSLLPSNILKKFVGFTSYHQN